MKQHSMVWAVGLLPLWICGCLAGEGSEDPLLGLPAAEEGDVAAGGGTSVAGEDVALSSDTEKEKECEAPSGQLGVSPGQYLDVARKLRTCEGEMLPLSEAVCGAKAILVDIGAQWCQPCKDEASHLEAEINAYFGDDVKVVSVVTQDKNSNPATNETCKWWTEEFGLTSPVMTDPFNNTNQWVLGDASSTMPVNIILDEEFRIVSYLTGGIAPEELRAKLEGVIHAD